MSEDFRAIVERNMREAAINPDHKPDGSGLDDGPYLPGKAPRKKPAPKSASEIADIRSRAWATRRQKYGDRGHR